jgi:RNA polymerase sigma factor (sigma-70 family)
MSEASSSAYPGDQTLRDRILASPEEGWKVFWETYGGFIHRIIGRFDLSPEDSEEVSQEVCHALIKDDFKVLRIWNPGRCSLRGFLSVIAAHSVANFYRSSFHRFTLRKSNTSGNAEASDEHHSSLMEATFTAAERLYRAQVVGILRKSLDEWVSEEKLCPTDRNLILLRLQGLSFREISTLIGITTSYATVRFSRMKPLLRKRLEEAGIQPEA